MATKSKKSPKPAPKKAAKKAPVKPAKKPASHAPKAKKPAPKPARKPAKPAPAIMAKKPAAPAAKPAKKAKPAPVVKTAKKIIVPPRKTAAPAKVTAKKPPLQPVGFLAKQRDRLLTLKDTLLDSMNGVAKDSLRSRAEGSEASAFGMHQADAGSDAYDRDFALSLVSNEQEALAEIEAAIKRIRDGTYGICESTQKPIAKERLLAVPFTRYSAEAKKQVERHSHRAQQRGGLFGDANEEDGGGKAADDDAGSDE